MSGLGNFAIALETTLNTIGYFVNPDIQSLNSVEIDKFPWAMIRWDLGAVSSQVSQTANYITWDISLGIEFATYSTRDDYEMLCLDEIEKLTIFIENARQCIPPSLTGDWCLIDSSMQNWRIIGFDDQWSCGGGVVVGLFTLRIPRNCNFC